MPYLKPFRNIDSYDIINYNTPLSGAQVFRGTVVKFAGSGINLQNNNSIVNLTPPTNLINSSVYGSYSAFFGAPTGGLLVPASSGENNVAVGVTWYDQLTVDEYNTPLLYNQWRAQQMQAVITGQSMPVITEGIVLYSGIDNPGSAAAGSGVQVSDTTPGQIKIVGPAVTPKIGKCLGPIDANGYALISFDFNS